MTRKQRSLLPRYEEIALDLAEEVARGEIKVGEKLTGRSGLAGRFKVSPETIRRSVALLHAQGVLRSVPGSGIRVESREAAVRYVQESEEALALLNLETEVRGLLEERRQLDDRLSQAIGKLVRATQGSVQTMRHVVEIEVPEASPLVGRSLQEAGLREKTGVTVIGIARRGEELFSPNPAQRIEAEDILIVVGSEEAKEGLRRLMTEP